VPDAKTVLERFGPAIVVEISLALPRQAGPFHLDLDPGARRETVPDVPLLMVEREGGGVQRLGVDLHDSAHPAMNGIEQARVALLDMDMERIACPLDPARPDRERRRVARDGALSALGHHPARFGPVKRDIECAVVQRVLPATALVIG